MNVPTPPEDFPQVRTEAELMQRSTSVLLLLLQVPEREGRADSFPHVRERITKMSPAPINLAIGGPNIPDEVLPSIINIIGQNHPEAIFLLGAIFHSKDPRRFLAVRALAATGIVGEKFYTMFKELFSEDMDEFFAAMVGLSFTNLFDLSNLMDDYKIREAKDLLGIEEKLES